MRRRSMQDFLPSRECAVLSSFSKAIPASAGMTLRRPEFHICAVAAALLAAPAGAEEKPAEIIAAHIRMQGYTCENALAAERDHKASKPNETVWTLRCGNGTYRVTLVPD